MVGLSLVVVAAPGQEKWMTSALRSLRAKTLHTLGCLRCHVSVDLDDPQTFHYVEQWGAEFDFREEIGSERFNRLIAIMEAAAARPQFALHFVSRSAGLDYIEGALRRARA
jgi:quinol monooxygenase YgiN